MKDEPVRERDDMPVVLLVVWCGVVWCGEVFLWLVCKRVGIGICIGEQ